MKKTIALYALFIAATVAFSCNKKVFPIPLEVCNISAVTVTENGSPDTTFYQLGYDREGRLTHLQSTSGGITGARTYTYSDTNLVVQSTGGAVDSVTLNSQGLMLVDISRSAGLLTAYYTYVGNEVATAYDCIGCETPPGPGPVSFYYTWSNGDLDNVHPFQNSTNSTGYGYDSLAAAVGDYFYITQLLDAPAPTVKATNQVNVYYQAYATSTVTYSKYPNGRISGMTIITSGPAEFGYGAPDTVNYTYQYACQLLSPIPTVK
jgi:hypothetical protein